MRHLALALVALMATTPVAAAADSPIHGRLTSAALGEVREYSVRLPAGYASHPQQRYAVAFVLDGPPLDAQVAAGAAQSTAAGVSPELIVVGIPNMQRGGRARDFLPPYLQFARRDGTPFTGGADRFLRFLRDELVPRIDRDYRTARPRVLVGHSLGAIFAVHSLSVAPDLFDARFVHSPAIWRDEDRIAQALATSLHTARGLRSFVYLSTGANEGSMQRGYVTLRAVLEREAAAAGLRWRAAITPGAAHETNVALATPASLAAFFRP